jgi:hypothetical protein
MKGMKLTWSQFWQLLSTYAYKIPVDQTERLLGISRPTIYRWYTLFRKHLPDQEDVRLEGIVQLDEAYFGSRKNGMAVIAARQQGSKKVAAITIPASSVQRSDITPFLRQYVIPGSKLHTDGALIYKGIQRYWPVEHAYDKHSKGEFGKTSVIEGFFGSLRTFIRRMYHHVTLKKLPEMIKEYQCRMMYEEMFSSPAQLLSILIPKFPFA